MTTPKFNRQESKRIDEQRALRSDLIFEVVRRDGVEELSRPAASLAWSGIAAGLAIGFSVVAEAAMKIRLPSEQNWSMLIQDMGYTVGFILVVLSKLQLFTENTITPVMPICYAPTRKNFAALMRIWIIVFAANMVGAILFGTFVMKTSALSPEMQEAIIGLGRHAAHGDFVDTMVRGVGAGFLIAALVWLLANRKGGELAIIFVVTYVIAICGFSHVVAGAVEMTALVVTGNEAFGPAAFGFVLPALIGNVIGGTVLFTMIAYGQIRHELEEN